jgi:hypothetical protein fuD12_07320
MKLSIRKILISFLFFVCCFVLEGKPIKAYKVNKEELLFQTKVISLELTDNDKEAEKLYMLLSGTMAVETRLGQHKTNKMGVSQLTKVAYKEIHKQLKFKKNKKLLNKLNVIYGSDILKISYHKLEHDYRAAILYTAAYYEIRGVKIKNINNKHDAARVWKKHYNTHKGKGTIKRFLKVYNEELE